MSSGTVRFGQVVNLPTVPIIALREAPLVDGKWLDRHVVELAEAGAILAKQGFAFEIADDNHPLVWDVAVDGDGAAAPPETAQEALRAARENLERCPAKTRKIDGRRYVAFEGYRGWRGRKLKGRFEVSDGIEVASWNRWVADQGERVALAGVRVQPFEWASDFYPTTVCDDTEQANRRALRRKQTLAELRVWFLNDSGVDGFWRKRLPVVGGTFDDATRQWRSEAEELLRDLLDMREALAIVEGGYFNGRDSLFLETRSELEAAVSAAKTVAATYEPAFAETRRRHTSAVASEATDPARQAVDVAAMERSVVEGARAIARRLVDMARAEAFTYMGDAQRARALVAPHVWSPGA